MEMRTKRQTEEKEEGRELISGLTRQQEGSPRLKVFIKCDEKLNVTVSR